MRIFSYKNDLKKVPLFNISTSLFLVPWWRVISKPYLAGDTRVAETSCYNDQKALPQAKYFIFQKWVFLSEFISPSPSWRPLVYLSFRGLGARGEPRSGSAACWHGVCCLFGKLCAQLGKVIVCFKTTTRKLLICFWKCRYFREREEIVMTFDGVCGPVFNLALTVSSVNSATWGRKWWVRHQQEDFSVFSILLASDVET